MIITERWIREWVSPDIDIRSLAQRLTLAGLEVTAITPVGLLPRRIVVGRIESVSPHPRSDRLRVCAVAAGRARPVPVVCGAANARPGLCAPLALPGVTLADGRRLAKVLIEGVESAGMLCSAAELGLGDEADVLLELDDDAPTGATLNDWLGLDDRILEIDLTPNRGDCLSVAGLAREISALIGAALREPRIAKMRGRSTRRVPLRLAAPADCPRYAGRIIEGVDPRAHTPDWMRERLRRSGLRCVSAIVDVTNYVMLELGQPLHAFDLDRLDGGIAVRGAGAGERLTLLDGTTIDLAPGTLLITDRSGPVALAGIMGGMSTAIGEETVNILLESAHFRPGAVAATARALGLQTDASHRFERGVDPRGQATAIERATALLLKICGGRPGPVFEQTADRYLPRNPWIRLRRERIGRLLGSQPDDEEVAAILRSLGMTVRPLAGGWWVVAPSRRFDIIGEHDLIEEVARVHGLDRFPSRAPGGRGSRGGWREAVLDSQRFRDLLVDRDYREVITYSFVDSRLQEQVEPGQRPIALQNPIASNMAVMRTSLWPGLLATLAGNGRRQRRRIRIFECGHVFQLRGGQRIEIDRLAGAACGTAAGEVWDGPSRPLDFYDVKGDVEALLGLGGCGAEFTIGAGSHPALHPGQCARIERRGRHVGVVGRLHPSVQKGFGIDTDVYLFELDLAELEAARVPAYVPISRYPATRRDISVVVDDGVPACQVRETIAEAAGADLKSLELFDVYRGPGIPQGRKSMSYALTFQRSSSNLNDAEIEEISSRVIAALGARLNGELRT